MKHLYSCAAILISTVLTASGAAAGQLYKWTDANGRVQYSDTKPTGAKAEPMRSVSPPADPAAAGANYSEKEQAFKKRRLEAAEQDQKVAQEAGDKARKEENCRRAKSALASLENGGRFYETDEKGERKYLEQDRIDSEKERLRSNLAANCS
jgi:hypothetical protein